SIESIHRLTSVNPVGKAVFDWLQGGPYAEQTNRLYRDSLRADHREIYRRMAELLEERVERPEKILVACTHPGLAHKLTAIKYELQQREHVKMVVAVCVTDDTFQHVWYVDGADLLAVPSTYTKRRFEAYGEHIPDKPRVEVVPYPIHPGLGAELDAEQLSQKTREFDSTSTEPIHISVPISGAAVGTGYASALMDHLHQTSDRFRFHVVSKDTSFTQAFLSGLRGKTWIDVRAATQDREVVNHYNNLMATQTLAFEVTKPSEQTFKVLAPTSARGGVILLFTQPVGVQEFDNINFLQRYSLVPSSETNDQLWSMAAQTSPIDAAPLSDLLEQARLWRGVRIPADPQQAAAFIWWMQTSGFFSRMMQGCLDRKIQDEDGHVLGPNGVAEFWDLAASI
ncbi:MAG TPA: hypothetical protein VIU38_10420, partial [Anaerolineales bacterium]